MVRDQALFARLNFKATLKEANSHQDSTHRVKGLQEIRKPDDPQKEVEVLVENYGTTRGSLLM